MSVQTTTKQVTVATLRKMKREGEKIACLTAYDASFSAVLDAAGMDVILVGDSLGMVVQGHTTTVPVKVADMIYHSRAVASRCKRALLMVDMPFMSYTSPQQALESAARLMQDGAGHMVKLEGDSRQVETVEKLVEHGVPVCAHIGLQPQLIHKLGGYRVQGRGDDQAKKMIDDALALEQAGADAILLECVVEPLAAELTEKLTIPTIGIGASAKCDGQILVLQDILGITPGRAPKFAHNFLQQSGDIQTAVGAYIQAVKNGEFPENEHIFES
ncbi:MAG TPA: 3-methyl-2-oxobutanoate hydroxymethyltransferase [Gammaproteobacteria bacterium]|jgi:3-methyl-2-oxobutanoate hydroxymethyltransferase|nr:3-methyl-2-oxobutanoate hydroxymethyltransferase [Gammaproteobacteria bacterium]